ncbi:DUF7059 domain-containing protein [Glutamicibacter sp. X7]
MNAAEFATITDAPHSDNLELLHRLYEDLSALDYGNERLAELVGTEAMEALGRDQTRPALRALDRAEPAQRPLADAVRLFELGLKVSAGGVTNAFPATRIEGLRRLGLIESYGEGFRARVALSIHESDVAGRLWVAHDLGAHQRPGTLRTDHVLGIGHASLSLAQVTIRRPVQRALDLGTGCGVQVFHLLGHAQHVTATDLSERALAFTRFNLLLNHRALDLDPQNLGERISLRQGSLFEPVAAEQFELIVTNPPFVITPRKPLERDSDRFTYRDGGMAGDQLVSTLLTQAADYLSPGGTLQLLANWEIRREPSGELRPWDERVASWFAPELDVWAIQREQTGPASYAETWLRDASQHSDQSAYAAAYDAYLEDFDSREVGAVGFGYLWVRRPLAGKPVLRRFEEITHPVQQPLGPTLQRDIATVDELDQADITDWHLEVAEDVTEERHQRPGAEHPGVILLRQGAGLRRTELLDSALAGFVSACDGELSVGQLGVALESLIGEGDPEFTQRLYSGVERLIVHGLLRKV